MTEKSRIKFGNTDIDFFVERSPRRNTVSLFVDPYEGVYLRAPVRTSLETLSRVVYSRGAWILKKQRRIDEIKELLPQHEGVSGETFLYLGKQYRLKIINNHVRKNNAALKGRHLIVQGHFGNNGEYKNQIKRNLKQWYKRHALPVLKRRCEIYAKKLKIELPEIFLGNQLRRWASCHSQNKIYFNWQILMAPMPLIDYVVAHELCHLIHHNHSLRYWALLGRIMPDYEQRRNRLRKEGPKYSF